ncbi:MAG: YifB family Mg chelatase-like AAA ATPase, partial [Lachnospiraceae bacterium]|nr:YifB family Mg chelatase-like AAA ATPase [Lachnospiraceae bacterium]
GELGLNGHIYPVNGVLPMALAACDCGKRICVVPRENFYEAAMVSEMKVVGVSDLKEVVDYLNEGTEPMPPEQGSVGAGESVQEADFKYINGQKILRRACEISAAGLHNLLMIGPPGSGKTMAAKCIPSILPPMNREEQMELSKIYSVCGKFEERSSLMDRRPFRSPHHTISTVGLVGGGRDIRPGEVSLAHGGVLFLDELTEFRHDVMEALRQPLEDRQVSIVRANGSYSYPAQFVLVAAMNPCKCGYFPDLNRCQCTQAEINRYLFRISQPMLDRIDICVEAPRLEFREIRSSEKNESSESIRNRVLEALAVQKERFEGTDILYNSRIPVKDMDRYCILGEKEEKYMEEAYKRLSLTARTFHKLLRVARTIADLEGSEKITTRHLTECMCYRCIDKSEWGNGL